MTGQELSEGMSNSATGLCCGYCHTPLEAIKMGNPIGCSQCYNIFSDVLFSELLEEDKIPQAMKSARRNQPLHIGKTPEGSIHIPSSSRLTALNEAMNEALSKENYEEAAWLRDQINELMEKKDDAPS
jgi:protein arginine kinase activator